MTLNPVLRIDAQMVETILAHENVSTRDAARRARAKRWSRSAFRRPDERLHAPIRTSSPAACASAWRSRSRCSTIRTSSSPTSRRPALDVTIQGQILFEMQKLTRETGAALIWITHDLSVVAGLADRVCVMYAGPHRRAGQRASTCCRSRAHPYTQGLLDSVPSRTAQRGAAAEADPGHDAVAARPAAGLRVSRALQLRHATNARRCRRRCCRPARRRRAGACAATIRSMRPARHERDWQQRAACVHAAAPPLVELARRVEALREVARRRRADRQPARRGHARRRSSTRWTTSISRSHPAKSSGSSANPGAASPRSAGSPSGFCRCLAGERCWQRQVAGAVSRRDAARRQQLKMQMIFRIRTRRSIRGCASSTSSAKRRSRTRDRRRQRQVGIRRPAAESRRARSDR